jgi:hypothetical protein
VKINFDAKDVYKIGITENICSRISNYRCGTINEPAFIYYFPCKDIKMCDKIMKENLMKLKVKREIYKGGLAEIRSILEASLSVVNNGEVNCFESEFRDKDVSECIYCKKIFCSKVYLYNHTVKCTAKWVKDQEIASQLQTTDIKYDSKRCYYCNRTFLRAYNLTVHLQNRCKIKQKRDQEKEDLTTQLIKEREDQKKVIEEQKKKIDMILVDKVEQMKQMKQMKTDNYEQMKQMMAAIKNMEILIAGSIQ